MVAVTSKTRNLARRARILTLETIHHVGEGHYGGSFSCIDIMSVLFELIASKSTSVETEDKFILSKGHAAPGYYALLTLYGHIERAELANFAQVDAMLQGHPDMVLAPAVAFSTGSLGQGLSAGLGMSIALKESSRAVWVLLGDGECQEGQVWEAAQLAARLESSNLIAIIDANGYQECGFGRLQYARPPIDRLCDKWRAFGWSVLECNGHDHDELSTVLERARGGDSSPCAIIAHTHKGYGASLLEREPSRFHCDSLTETEYQSVMEELLSC